MISRSRPNESHKRQQLKRKSWRLYQRMSKMTINDRNYVLKFLSEKFSSNAL